MNQTQTLVFYDGACPVCVREMQVLRRHDRAQRLAMVDIAAADFDAHAWPASRADMNAALHVRLPDGSWRSGMAAIRHIYRVIGKGWWLAPTGWPLISHVFDRLYAAFARHRLVLSARLDFGTTHCANGTCRLSR